MLANHMKNLGTGVMAGQVMPRRSAVSVCCAELGVDDVSTNIVGKQALKKGLSGSR